MAWTTIFLFEANRIAPHRSGTTSRGAYPEHRHLITLVKACRTELARSGEGQKTASLKWLALKPEGPGAVPLGKDIRAFTTSDSLILTGEGIRVDGIAGLCGLHVLTILYGTASTSGIGGE